MYDERNPAFQKVGKGYGVYEETWNADQDMKCPRENSDYAAFFRLEAAVFAPPGKRCNIC